ncbi:MAG: DNA polymerase III subunit beta [Bacillota bacterium]|jgi:DNA polymerase-3 subunit beta
MKINCQKEDLLYGVQSVFKAISTKNTLPILGGIMLIAENDQLIFKATDLEIAIECIINVDVEQSGVVVVQGKYFNEMVRNLPDGDVTLHSMDEKQINIIYGQSGKKAESSLNCFDPEEFPALPEVTGEISGNIPAEVFKRLVRQVSIAAATDEIRPIFTGILVDLKPQQITMVATDTHRLAVGKGVWQGEGEGKFILPARTMVEISRLLAEGDSSININISKNQAHFCAKNITFTSMVINGQYPNYQQVLPAENLYTSKTVIDRKQLMETLGRAAIFVGENGKMKGNIAKLTWQNDNLSIVAGGADLGILEEDIYALLEGEEVEASYNVRYLLDVLKVINSEKIVMRLTGSLTPGIIMPDEVPDDESFLYLILPIRTTN